MKLIYIANSRIPTEKAHGLQIMKMCEAFALQKSEILNSKSETNLKSQIPNPKIEVELVVPKRFNPITENPFEYYGVNKSFKIKYLPVLDLIKFGRLGFWLESLIFSKVVAIYLFFRKADIIYGRDEMPLYFLSFFKKNIFWEAHQGRTNFTVKRLLKKAAGVITISAGLKIFFKHKRGDILVSPDAVDFDAFNISNSKEEYRRKFNLPLDKKIVLYAGHFYKWKGVDILAGAAQKLSDVIFIFVGGTREDITNFREKVGKFQNIIIVGHRPYSEIPLWLKAADILVLPNSAKEEISRSFTSPMKLFEYMASGAPIIASDLPSIREIVNENEVLFFKPDDVQDLIDKIKYAFENYEEMKLKGISAKQRAAAFTWQKRAENIFSFITQKKFFAERSDFWPSLIAGAGIALLGLPTLKNLSFFDHIFFANRGLAYGLLVLYFLILSFGAILGVYIAKLIGRKKPVIYQIAKYGLIGWLNVFLYAGIFNLFSWFTGIASGIIADLFLLISFAATTTNAFFWNKAWTFKAGFSGDGRKEYIKFFAVSGLTSVLNILLFHLIVNTIGAPEKISEEMWANIAIFALIPVSFLGNFFGYKFFVFKDKVSETISRSVA